jgi:hypothetical protein
MINPDSGQPMTGLDEKMQDFEMIENSVMEEAEEVYSKQEKFENINNMVIEAFTLGLVAQLASDDEPGIPEEDEDMTEDRFRYQTWQIELCRYLEEEPNSTDWPGMKSIILRKGLRKISSNA